MQNCEFVTFISILACSIAKDKTQDELNILSAFFVQLRRYSSNFIQHKFLIPGNFNLSLSKKYKNNYLSFNIHLFERI